MNPSCKPEPDPKASAWLALYDDLRSVPRKKVPRDRTGGDHFEREAGGAYSVAPKPHYWPSKNPGDYLQNLFRFRTAWNCSHLPLVFPVYMTIIDATDIDRELEQIRNRHGIKPLVTSERDAALVELASPIPSVRWRAKQIVNKSPRKRRKAVRGSRHYKYKRKVSKRGVYKFYWSHQEERRFHGWKCLHSPEHVFLTLEEWTVIREAALARKTKSWALKKRDYNRCWTWDNVFVLVDKESVLDPRLELERPESCPRPDLRFVGKRERSTRSTSKIT